MKADLVCNALDMALWRRKFPEGVIFHSDRGSQYCADTLRILLKEHSLLQSMSRKGDGWDNYPDTVGLCGKLLPFTEGGSSAL